jgi:DNA polymerase eta
VREIKEDSKIGPYSNIQLSFSGLERSEGGQRGIEGFFSATAAGKASEEPVRVKREATTEGQEDNGKGKRRKAGADENDEASAALANNDGDEITLASTPPPPSRSHTPEPPGLPTYTCPSCRRVLSLSSSAINSLRPSFDASAAALLLQKEKDEHADWHFAREMVEKDRKKTWAGSVKSTGGSSKGRSEKSGKAKGGEKAEGKKQKGQQSLKSFFG